MHEQVLEKPLCAVLLAAYNGMAYLSLQIESILKQESVQVRLFISVDCSTDGTEAWLTDKARSDPRIVLLPHGSHFGGAAKNFFRLIREVDLSPYPYIAFSDQDDQWHLDKLKNACYCLSTESYDAYSSNVTAFWADGRHQLVHKAQPQKPWDFLFEAAGPGCTYVFSQRLMAALKEKILEQWDLVQEVSLHDWLSYAFARANGYRWYIDTNPSILYRQHEKNQVGINSGWNAYLNRLKKIQNGWWLSQALLIAYLVGLQNDAFVAKWSKLRRRDLFRLAWYAQHCRRNRRDQVLFFVFCIYLGFAKMPKPKIYVRMNRS